MLGRERVTHVLGWFASDGVEGVWKECGRSVEGGWRWKGGGARAEVEG